MARSQRSLPAFPITLFVLKDLCLSSRQRFVHHKLRSVAGKKIRDPFFPCFFHEIFSFLAWNRLDIMLCYETGSIDCESLEKTPKEFLDEEGG